MPVLDPAVPMRLLKPARSARCPWLEPRTKLANSTADAASSTGTATAAATERSSVRWQLQRHTRLGHCTSSRPEACNVSDVSGGDDDTSAGSDLSGGDGNITNWTRPTRVRAARALKICASSPCRRQMHLHGAPYHTAVAHPPPLAAQKLTNTRCSLSHMSR